MPHIAINNVTHVLALPMSHIAITNVLHVLALPISVAYRYRKSISIIELFVSIILIYIEFLATNF